MIGYRSPWGRNVGGATKPTEAPVGVQAGDRSPLFYWGGGAAKPPSTGTYAGPRSMLAFWMGGACFHYVPPPPLPPPAPPISDLTGGLPGWKRGHGERDRIDLEKRVIDDEDVIEFLRLWVLFNENCE